jgi:hypothetical protein
MTTADVLALAESEGVTIARIERTQGWLALCNRRACVYTSTLTPDSVKAAISVLGEVERR